MSEFKFACPICGQHITADSRVSGGQIECPTCFQKIVVPQAPESAETKLILSATQVGKPRPASPDSPFPLGPLRNSSRRSSLPGIIVLLVLVGAAGGTFFLYRDRILKALRKPASAATNALEPQPTAAVALNPTYPIPTNFSWTLDLTKAAFPQTTAAGRIHGSGFLCERAFLRGGQLSLSQGKAWPWDLGVTIHLFARQGEELSGKTVEIPPNRLQAPSVVLRWKEAQQQPTSETINSGYSLKVVFGQATNSHMPGLIYICLPDETRSFVAGEFDAEIRRVPPPQPPPAKPRG